MANRLEKLGQSARRQLLVEAAKRGAEEAGYALERLPGRGLSNVWRLTKGGQVKVTSIRTTRDRWIAYPPLESGTKWKTLSEVELVLVAAADDTDDPQKVEVYLFDAAEVRRRFDAAYAARSKAGLVVDNDFGMWVALDLDKRGIPTSVGSGLVDKHKPIAVYAIDSLVEGGIAGRVPDLEPELEAEEERAEPAAPSAEEAPLTIAEAKRRLARTLGVDPSSIKITVEA